MLQAGGNAVDAAVAVGFTLAVTFPQAGNLGGGGFMLIRMADGQTTVVDYRGQAPAAATRRMYQDAQGDLIPGASTIGARATGVPGTVMGLVLAEKNYGRLGLAKVMAPAIRLARSGTGSKKFFGRLVNGVIGGQPTLVGRKVFHVGNLGRKNHRIHIWKRTAGDQSRPSPSSIVIFERSEPLVNKNRPLSSEASKPKVVHERSEHNIDVTKTNRIKFFPLRGMDEGEYEGEQVFLSIQLIHKLFTICSGGKTPQSNGGKTPHLKQKNPTLAEPVKTGIWPGKSYSQAVSRETPIGVSAAGASPQDWSQPHRRARRATSWFS